MKMLIWVIIVVFGLASLPFGGTAFAGQGRGAHRHKIAAHAAHAGKAGKHHTKKHHMKPAGKRGTHKNI